jgi:predicted transcriptional regulator
MITAKDILKAFNNYNFDEVINKEGIVNKLKDLGFKVNAETPEDKYSGILVKLEL